MELILDIFIIAIAWLTIICLVLILLKSYDSTVRVIKGYSESPGNEGQFLSSCISTGVCQEGLLCDPNTYLCKYNVGQECTSYYDCVGTAYCSGRCVTGYYGGLNQYCPCNDGLRCVKQSDGTSICVT